MASTYRWWLCFMCCFYKFYLYNTRVEARNFSKYEDLNLEKELELLNKPSVKTIWTKDGESYNCVYFDKERESTRNPSFQPRIKTALYDGMKNTRIYESRFNNLWRNNEACPIGTVPIRKTTRDGLIRAKLAADIYAGKNAPFTEAEHGTHYAVLRKSGIFYGAGMRTTVWNPIVSGAQYSSSQMKLQNGVDAIEVGWTVNPYLYNDTFTRIYVYTQVDGQQCFNAYCGLFVPESGIPIERKFVKISRRNRGIYQTKFLIQQESSSGDWVLKIGEDEDRVGRWPKSIFSKLGNYATFVEWGSKVYSPPNIPSPPMGSGSSVLKEDTLYDACCQNLEILDKPNGDFEDVTRPISYTDNVAYTVKDEGIIYQHGRLMFYGGAGGVTGN